MITLENTHPVLDQHVLDYVRRADHLPGEKMYRV